MTQQGDRKVMEVGVCGGYIIVFRQKKALQTVKKGFMVAKHGLHVDHLDRSIQEAYRQTSFIGTAYPDILYFIEMCIKLLSI